jgi:hypothetical protein
MLVLPFAGGALELGVDECLDITIKDILRL